MAQSTPLRTAGLGRPLPRVYITMQCKVRDFIADQERIATLKCDWLYKLCSPEGRAKLLIEAGFTPARAEDARDRRRSTQPTCLGT